MNLLYQVHQIIYTTDIKVKMYNRNTSDEGVIDDLKNCISILFNFEQRSHNALNPTLKIKELSKEIMNSDEMSVFRNNVRKWIRQMVALLLRVATVDDHRFIIFEAIRCRYIGQWGADLIQITDIKSDTAVDFFIAVLSVFLTPIYFNPSVNKSNTEETGMQS